MTLTTAESPSNICHLAILISFSSQPRHPHNKSTKCLLHYVAVYSYPLYKIYVINHIEHDTLKKEHQDLKRFWMVVKTAFFILPSYIFLVIQDWFLYTMFQKHHRHFNRCYAIFFRSHSKLFFFTPKSVHSCRNKTTTLCDPVCATASEYKKSQQLIFVNKKSAELRKMYFC